MKICNRQIEAYCTQRHVQNALGLRGPVSSDFLAQGEYNINHVVTGQAADGSGPRHIVFRLNTASQLQLDNQIAYEYRALEGLACSGVTPAPLFLDDTKTAFPYGLLCMEYLEGRPLDYKRDLSHAARLFATIHSLDTAPFEEFMIREDFLCRHRVSEGRRWLGDYLACPDAPMAVRNTLSRFADSCELLAPETDSFFNRSPWLVVNNTEVNSHNFIIGEEGQYIIDWEKPVISDPAQDVTQFLAPTTTLWRTDYLLSREEIEGFYRTYALHSGRDAQELAHRVGLYRPFLYLRALTWCAGAWVAYREERTITNPRTWHTINAYLDPAFLENLLADYMKNG